MIAVCTALEILQYADDVYLATSLNMPDYLLAAVGDFCDALGIRGNTGHGKAEVAIMNFPNRLL